MGRSQGRPDRPSRQRNGHGRKNLRRTFQLSRVADDEFARDLGRRDASAHRKPQLRNQLELVETIPANIRGQGIAWDRSDRGVLYGIIRATRKGRDAGGSNKVTVFRMFDVP